MSLELEMGHLNAYKDGIMTSLAEVTDGGHGYEIMIGLQESARLKKLVLNLSEDEIIDTIRSNTDKITVNDDKTFEWFDDDEDLEFPFLLLRHCSLTLISKFGYKDLSEE